MPTVDQSVLSAHAVSAFCWCCAQAQRHAHWLLLAGVATWVPTLPAAATGVLPAPACICHHLLLVQFDGEMQTRAEKAARGDQVLRYVGSVDVRHMKCSVELKVRLPEPAAVSAAPAPVQCVALCGRRVHHASPLSGLHCTVTSHCQHALCALHMHAVFPIFALL